MPALSGTEIVKLIKEKSGIRVLLYSAKEEGELRTLAAVCGADGYVKKGTYDAHLADQVRSAIDVSII